MGAILIRCTTTQELVPVGIDTDKDSFGSLPEVKSMLVRCPVCGKDHTWTKSDAILDTTGRPAPRK